MPDISPGLKEKVNSFPIARYNEISLLLNNSNETRHIGKLLQGDLPSQFQATLALKDCDEKPTDLKMAQTGFNNQVVDIYEARQPKTQAKRRESEKLEQQEAEQPVKRSKTL